MSRDVYVGVDVGGTKILAGMVDDAGRVLSTALRRTPGRDIDASGLEDAVTEAVYAAAGDRALRGVGLAAAGFVEATSERVMFAPHLPWIDAPIRERLERRWQVPVALENDATAAAHAEATHGAARGVGDAVMVTLGTGIGGGLILGGAVHRGWNGMAGEFGHMQVVAEGVPCECGGRGCWEQYCSGNALARYARKRIGTRPSVLEILCGGDPEALTGPMVTGAAADGDCLAREAFAHVGDWLGVGLANLVAAFDPACLVIGGGLAAAGEQLLEPAGVALRRSLVGVAHRRTPPMVLAELGAAAGLIGAADLVRAQVGRSGR